ncbi:MAG: nickel/cobalt efflux transporter [Hyphomicrobiaceae bacterium]
MPNIEALIQSGAGNAWLLLPTAVVLGALHALEPGHSKSMMTAFIVAINGTATQAALLAVSATIGHTIVVWALALIAWSLGNAGVLERAEPWLLLIGGVLIVALALRILLRLLPPAQGGHNHHDQSHTHSHGHHHHHDHQHPHMHDHNDEDAHAAAHTAELRKRLGSASTITSAEVAWFGFSGGLLPCPAAFAVLLACLHQKAYVLGLVMVAAFSIGLALMLVAIGIAAAWGADALKNRVNGFGRIAQWAPYVSAMIILVIGCAVVVQGAMALGLI